MNQRVDAPWTQEYVDDLNTMQANHMFHGYTCRDHSQQGVLRATTEGWVCDHEGCEYTQTWAVLYNFPSRFEDII